MSAHTITHKRTVRVTLDIECYEDLDVESQDWRELLDLQGDESVEVSVRDTATMCQFGKCPLGIDLTGFLPYV